MPPLVTPPLVLCAPAPVIETANGFRLDVKFVDGMHQHRVDWGGPVRCVLWSGADSIPFGREFQADELDFDLTILAHGQPIPESVFQDAGVVLVSGDMDGFDEIRLQVGHHPARFVMSLEYTLKTRKQILDFEDIGFLRRFKRKIWMNRAETRRRMCLRAAAGVQFNGYPALDTYGAHVKNPMMYLDNRMTLAMMATDAEMEARAAYLTSGAPLRLIHSGRLERMKGAQDLLPVMRELRKLGVDATLDIYGAGSLEGEISAGLSEFNGTVRLHGPVDFETQLVPISRTQADAFLSCHRQSDPSCTYVEAMGCGLAIAGYDNAMWSRLSAEAESGALAPMGNVKALAQRVARWDKNRAELIDSAARGLDFANAHHFDAEFGKRMDHLKSLLR